MGLCLLWGGVIDTIRLMGVWDILLGHLLSSLVLVLMLLRFIGVVWVLSLCRGDLKGHFGPLRVVFVLVVSFLSEFFVSADVVAPPLRESEVL